jgi:hypothetical protein
MSKRRNWVISVQAVAVALAIGGSVILLWRSSSGSSVFRDRFDRANNSRSLGSGPGDRGWHFLSGVWGVEDRQVIVTSPGLPRSVSVVDRGVADGRIQTTIARAATSMGLAFRVRDNRNLWAIVAVPQLLTWNIYRVVDGTETFVENTGVAHIAGQPSIAVDLQGDFIKVHVSGRPVKTITSPVLADETKAGLVLFGGDIGNARWASFSARVK